MWGAFSGLLTGHFHAQARQLARGKGIQHSGDFPWDARAHDDHFDPRKHGTVQASEIGDLDFGEQVDAHRTAVAFLGEPDLHEGGQSCDLFTLCAVCVLLHG